ncbi:hypothetical protein D3C71_1921160 [compost metagenome]
MGEDKGGGQAYTSEQQKECRLVLIRAADHRDKPKENFHGDLMRIEVPRPDRGMKPQVGGLMCFVRRTQVQLDLPRGDSRRL